MSRVQLISLSVDDRLKLVKAVMFQLPFKFAYEKRLQAFCRADRCRKRHHTLLYPPSETSSNGPRSYLNYHHVSDNLNTETSE